VDDARQRVTPKTKAVIPVHLFGQVADMDPLLEVASERKLRVVEDAAQAFGAAYRGKPAGSMGDFGTFSFFPSKNLGGFGDSGLLVTNDDALAEKARLLRTHGAKPKYFHKTVGGNFRMDPLQAALLGVKLWHLEEYSARRVEHANYYAERLSALPGLVLPSAHPHNKHIWNQYTIRVLGGKRDALRDHLAAREIGTEIYYPRPMHMQECFRRDGATQPRLPVCERLAAECLSIPVYPELSREQQDAVADAIADFVGNA
jgi:dTDP-4-amino-4,6-dideoxygalactose transaminase